MAYPVYVCMYVINNQHCINKFAARMYLVLKSTYIIEINHYLMLLLTVIYKNYILYANYVLYCKFLFLNNLKRQLQLKIELLIRHLVSTPVNY